MYGKHIEARNFFNVLSKVRQKIVKKIKQGPKVLNFGASKPGIIVVPQALTPIRTWLGCGSGNTKQ